MEQGTKSKKGGSSTSSRKDLGGEAMPRMKFQTLTEQMFYILLCLRTECFGVELFDRIAKATDNRVRVGSGTMYDLLEAFWDEGMIRIVQQEGRRRSYILTEYGRQVLDKEVARLRQQIGDYERTFAGEEPQ